MGRFEEWLITWMPAIIFVASIIGIAFVFSINRNTTTDEERSMIGKRIHHKTGNEALVISVESIYGKTAFYVAESTPNGVVHSWWAKSETEGN